MATKARSANRNGDRRVPRRPRPAQARQPERQHAAGQHAEERHVLDRPPAEVDAAARRSRWRSRGSRACDPPTATTGRSTARRSTSATAPVITVLRTGDPRRRSPELLRDQPRDARGTPSTADSRSPARTAPRRAPGDRDGPRRRRPGSSPSAHTKSPSEVAAIQNHGLVASTSTASPLIAAPLVVAAAPAGPTARGRRRARWPGSRAPSRRRRRGTRCSTSWMAAPGTRDTA